MTWYSMFEHVPKTKDRLQASIMTHIILILSIIPLFLETNMLAKTFYFGICLGVLYSIYVIDKILSPALFNKEEIQNDED